MAVDAKLNNLITKAFSPILEQNLPSTQILGKLAKTKFDTVLKIGDEVDLIMPGSVTLGAYTGGDLTSPESIANTTMKIKVNTGKSIYFEMDDDKEAQLNATLTGGGELRVDGNGNPLALKLIKEYTNDAQEQFKDAIDRAYAALYSKAGYKIDNGSGAAKAYTSATILQMFTAMKSKFVRGQAINSVYRSAWKDGKMIAIIPPEVEEIITADTRLQYTESGKKELENGFVGKIAGWRVFSSPNIVSSSGYYCMFGVEGETLGGICQKNLKLISNVRDESFNTSYKGKGLYGVDCYRSDKLGYAWVTAAYS